LVWIVPIVGCCLTAEKKIEEETEKTGGREMRRRRRGRRRRGERERERERERDRSVDKMGLHFATHDFAVMIHRAVSTNSR